MNRVIGARHYGVSSLLVASLTLTGCGGSPAKDVAGSVMAAGQTVEQGSIEFIPDATTGGRAVQSKISDGHYSFAASDGLVPGGTYTVRIIGLRKTGRTLTVPSGLLNGPTPKESTAYPELEEYLSAKYNTNSTYTVQLTQSTGIEELDIDLK